MIKQCKCRGSRASLKQRLRGRLVRFRFSFFRYAGAIALAAPVATVVVAQNRGVDINHIGAALAGAITFGITLQAQRTSALATFRTLFKEYNERYSKIHDEMVKFRNGREAASVTLSIYFDLCAEEYLSYSVGDIHPEAWEAWLAGMEAYLNAKDADKIRDFWIAESVKGSYYGLETILHKRCKDCCERVEK